jgi:hypothetical protein
MELQTKMSRPTWMDDDMEQYWRASIELRRKLGITSNRMTAEQERVFEVEQRKIWLRIHDPKKLEEEYGKSEPQS